MFGWKICDRISEIIAGNVNKSNGQNLSHKEKTALKSKQKITI